MPIPAFKHSDLTHYLVIYNLPEQAATATEYPDAFSAARAYEELDPDGFGGIYDVAIVAADSIETLERLTLASVTLLRAGGPA